MGLYINDSDDPQKARAILESAARKVADTPGSPYAWLARIIFNELKIEPPPSIEKGK